MRALERQLLAERFEILKEVGRGAAGVVFRALDKETGEASALKLIEPSDDPTDQERFLKEGEVLSSLSHPSIVRVLAYGTLDQPYADTHGHRFAQGSTFVAMEWLEGEDLAARQKRAQPALSEVLEIIRQVAEALACAHAAGIVHRDVKPSNVFLVYGTPRPTTARSGYSTLRGSQVDDGLPSTPPEAPLRAKLLDFGVAAAGDAMRVGAGAIVGTPAYMSPEQAQGAALPDARSDLYSLGATLFELCVGRPPHAGPTSIATLARRVTDPAPRLSDLLLDVPERLDDLVWHLLQIEPELRPPSAADVVRSLSEMLADPAIQRVGRLTLREADTRARGGDAARHDPRGARRGHRRAAPAAARPSPSDGRGRPSRWAPTRSSPTSARAAPTATRPRAPWRSRTSSPPSAPRWASRRAAPGVDLTRSSGEIVDRASKLAREAKDGPRQLRPHDQ
jgi:serine/threonine protein kinase